MVGVVVMEQVSQDEWNMELIWNMKQEIDSKHRVMCTEMSNL